MSPQATSPTAQLAAFAANLSFDNIPAEVIAKTEDLLVDWFGSAVAGKGSRPVETITAFAASMGPADGAAEVLIERSRSSAYFAAMANAAASHVAEQDDVHNGSVFHPAAVVFPPALRSLNAIAFFFSNPRFTKVNVTFNASPRSGNQDESEQIARPFPWSSHATIVAFGPCCGIRHVAQCV